MIIKLSSGGRGSGVTSITLKDINFFQKRQIDIIHKGGKPDTVEFLASSVDDNNDIMLYIL